MSGFYRAPKPIEGNRQIPASVDELRQLAQRARTFAGLHMFPQTVYIEDKMSREEAARNAARARWKGHVKDDPDSTDIYNKTFFAAHPHLKGKVVVHHAIERQVVDRYPGIWQDSDMHLMSNLRGIPKGKNDDLHLSRIRTLWNDFYRTHPTTTRKQLLDYASHIDRLVGSEFDPPV